MNQLAFKLGVSNQKEEKEGVLAQVCYLHNAGALS